MAILVEAETKVMVQGITGREAVAFTREMLDYGTQVVAGVTPGKGGADVYGVPVYDSVAAAVTEHAPDAAVVSVPAGFARDAAVEALENGIPCVVIVTERLPRRDVAEVLAVARETGGRVIGPNSLGVITPGLCKLGSIGGPARDVEQAFQTGPIGVMSRSGGMTTELASMLTQSGLGQSTCVSLGGDPMVGSTMVDVLQLFAADAETRAVVFFAEPGGGQERALADYVLREGLQIPIVGYIAGLFADEMPGVRFGHAGAMVEPGGQTTRDKVRMLQDAGVQVVERLAHLVPTLRTALHNGAG